MERKNTQGQKPHLQTMSLSIRKRRRSSTSEQVPGESAKKFLRDSASPDYASPSVSLSDPPVKKTDEPPSGDPGSNEGDGSSGGARDLLSGDDEDLPSDFFDDWSDSEHRHEDDISPMSLNRAAAAPPPALPPPANHAVDMDDVLARAGFGRARRAAAPSPRIAAPTSFPIQPFPQPANERPLTLLALADATGRGSHSASRQPPESSSTPASGYPVPRIPPPDPSEPVRVPPRSVILSAMAASEAGREPATQRSVPVTSPTPVPTPVPHRVSVSTVHSSRANSLLDSSPVLAAPTPLTVPSPSPVPTPAVAHLNAAQTLASLCQGPVAQAPTDSSQTPVAQPSACSSQAAVAQAPTESTRHPVAQAPTELSRADRDMARPRDAMRSLASLEQQFVQDGKRNRAALSLASISQGPVAQAPTGSSQAPMVHASTDSSHDPAAQAPAEPSQAGANQAGVDKKPRLTKKDKKPRQTMEERKKKHIASEKKRRQAVREGFDRLTELVPGLEGMGRSQGFVLQRTVEFIRDQIEERRRLIAQIEENGGQVDGDRDMARHRDAVPPVATDSSPNRAVSGARVGGPGAQGFVGDGVAEEGEVDNMDVVEDSDIVEGATVEGQAVVDDPMADAESPQRDDTSDSQFDRSGPGYAPSEAHEVLDSRAEEDSDHVNDADDSRMELDPPSTGDMPKLRGGGCVSSSCLSAARGSLAARSEQDLGRVDGAEDSLLEPDGPPTGDNPASQSSETAPSSSPSAAQTSSASSPAENSDDVDDVEAEPVLPPTVQTPVALMAVGRGKIGFIGQYVENEKYYRMILAMGRIL